MLSVFLVAGVIVAATVAVHAAGLALILSHLSAHDETPRRLWPVTWLLIKVAWLLLAFHAIEISLWALYFRFEGLLPDAESAFYFSGATYLTIGYGDLVLPRPWRLLAPVEGATGILMCGLSTGLFFAVLTRTRSAPPAPRTGPHTPPGGV